MSRIIKSFDSQTFVANTTLRQRIENLPREISGLPAHMVDLLIHVDIACTDAASVIEGEDFALHIDRLRLIDRFNRHLWDLTGYASRQMEKAVTGQLLYGDPADTPGTSGAITRDLWFRIPMQGGPNGVKAFRRSEDLYRPMEQLLGGQLEIVCGSATASGCTGFSATINIYPVLRAMPRIVVGADLRFAESSATATTGSIRHPAKRAMVLLAAFVDDDGTGTDLAKLTSIKVEEGNLVDADLARHLAAAFNASYNPNADHKLDPESPGVLPVIFPEAGRGIFDGALFESGEIVVKFGGASLPTTMYLASAQVHDTKDVASDLLTAVPALQALRAKPMAARHNYMKQPPAKRAILERFGAYVIQ